MEIKIGIGIGDLIFGMSQAEVKNILGEPDKVLSPSRVNTTVFHFNELLIETKFDDDDIDRLSTIEVHNPEAVMFNQKIIGKHRDEIMDLLRLNNYKKIEREDYDICDTVLCEEIWTEFRFEFDRLQSFGIGPLFKNNEEIIWPVRDKTHETKNI